MVTIDDMPTVPGQTQRATEIDVGGVVDIVKRIHLHAGGDARVYLEWPQTRPDESPESSKRFGVGLGILEGVFTAFGMPPVRVAPNKWKGRLGLSGKESGWQAARLEAVALAEAHVRGLSPSHLRGPRGGLLDGRAEAMLIAWYHLTETVDGLKNQPESVRTARLLMWGSKGGRRHRRGPAI